MIYGNTARASSEKSIRVTTRFYFVQAYDSERNLIEGALVQIPMSNVLVSIRDKQTNQLIKQGRTDAGGVFRGRVPPGNFSVGLAGEYYSNEFCQVPAPACLGYRVELRSRGQRKNVVFSDKRRTAIINYREELGV